MGARFDLAESGLRAIEVHDVTFAGCGGDPVKAWLALPAGTREPLPCVVEFPGYGGGRGLAHDVLLYAAAGYAHLFVDVRARAAAGGPATLPTGKWTAAIRSTRAS